MSKYKRHETIVSTEVKQQEEELILIEAKRLIRFYNKYQDLLGTLKTMRNKLDQVINEFENEKK